MMRACASPRSRSPRGCCAPSTARPSLVDLQKDVTVVANGTVVFQGKVAPDLAGMLAPVREFDDRGRVFHAAIDVVIVDDEPVPEPRL